MAGSDRKLFDSAKRPELRGCASAALLCDLAAEGGVTADRCLAGTGLDPSVLRDPAGEVTREQELQLIKNIIEELDDPPQLGLEAGTRYRLSTYGIWGFAVLTSRTVREAVEIGFRFIDLTFALTDISPHEEKGEVRFSFEDRETRESLRRFVLERDLSAAVAIGSETINAPVPLKRCELRLPEPENPDPYESVFRIRPIFDAPETFFAIDASLLDLPLPQASPLTAEASAQQCRDVLDRRIERHSVAGSVRHELLRDPRDMPPQDAVAKALHFSVRTLHRRLADEGTNFRELVEETRALLAEELLLTGSLTVEQIADRLGYSEASSFVHAFTRWKGLSPRRWQEAQTG